MRKTSIQNNDLMPITQTGWSRGLANVLHGELYTWFATRRWWVQILIWAACTNLIFSIVAFTTPNGEENIDSVLILFNIFMGLTGPIGVGIVMQPAIVGEKRSGTAAWIISKPVSRIAFVLSKLISNATGIFVTMVFFQGLIAYLVSFFALGVVLPIPGFLAGLGVHIVNILFYMTLALLMGVVFQHIGPIIGIPVAFLAAQYFLMSFFPSVVPYLPWTLAIPANNAQFPSISMELMSGMKVWTVTPIYMSLLYAAVFMVISIRIFEKQEL